MHTFPIKMKTSERMTAIASKFPLHGSMGALRGGAKVLYPPVFGRLVVRAGGRKVT